MSVVLHLVPVRVLVDDGSTYRSSWREVTAAGLRLVCPPEDSVGEAEARRVLESFGPVELDGGHGVSAVPDGSESADYVVDIDGDADALVSFTCLVVPRLRAMGWQIEIDVAYPCQIVEAESWYGRADDAEERGWFDLELGLEVDGQRVDVLPLVLDLLARGTLEVSSRLRRPMMALPLGGDRYVPVPVERIRVLMRVVQELYECEGTHGTPRVPAMAPFWFDELDGAVGEKVCWYESEDANSACRRPKGVFPTHDQIEAVPQPGELRATLRPYQREGLGFLQALARHGAGGILADDMGLGKTLQTIAHLCVEKEAGRLGQPALIVAPTSLMGNWHRELTKFAPHLRVVVLHGSRRARTHLWRQVDAADVVITTYGLAVREAARLGEIRFHILVLDEAQAIKNPRGRAHEAVCGLDANLRLCLTGTPIENHLEELRSLFEFLMPGFLGSAEQFRRRFRVPIEKGGDPQARHQRLETLRNRVRPFMLRRLKEEVVAELPPKTTVVRPIELEGAQRDLYESIRVAAHDHVRKVVRTKGIAASTVDVLGALTKLRQACCDPRLLPFESAEPVEESAKFATLMAMLEDMVPRGRRVLVFSQFTSMLALIAEGLRVRKIRYLSLTGSTTDRQGMVEGFERGYADVFLISLKAGGTGLNLVGADTVIHYDPWWNPAAKRQATDRAHRIGQDKPVIVYELIAAGSVEERMLRLQLHKEAIADSVLKNAGAGASLWNEAEVDHLFSPLTD